MTRETSFGERFFSAFCAFQPRGHCIASNYLTIHNTDSESHSKVLKILYLRDIENFRPAFILSILFLTLSCSSKSDKHFFLRNYEEHYSKGYSTWTSFTRLIESLACAKPVDCLCTLSNFTRYFARFFEHIYYIYIQGESKRERAHYFCMIPDVI